MKLRRRIREIRQRLSWSHWVHELHYWWSLVGTGAKLSTLAGVIFVAAIAAFGLFAAKKHREALDLQCLALNIYHEARGEPLAGKYAVAQVTLNRVQSPEHPNSICAVVFKQAWSSKYQRHVAAFSWTNDSLTNLPRDTPAWRESLDIAKKVYFQDVRSEVGDALFYHADTVKPSWAKQKTLVAKIGHHIFYR